MIDVKEGKFPSSGVKGNYQQRAVQPMCSGKDLCDLSHGKNCD